MKSNEIDTLFPIYTTKTDEPKKANELSSTVRDQLLRERSVKENVTNEFIKMQKRIVDSLRVEVSKLEADAEEEEEEEDEYIFRPRDYKPPVKTKGSNLQTVQKIQELKNEIAKNEASMKEQIKVEENKWIEELLESKRTKVTSKKSGRRVAGLEDDSESDSKDEEKNKKEEQTYQLEEYFDLCVHTKDGVDTLYFMMKYCRNEDYYLTTDHMVLS